MGGLLPDTHICTKCGSTDKLNSEDYANWYKRTIKVCKCGYQMIQFMGKEADDGLREAEI